MENETRKETDPPPARHRKRKASPRKRVSRIQKTLEQGFVLDKNLFTKRPESRPAFRSSAGEDIDSPAYTEEEIAKKSLYLQNDEYNSLQTFEEQELPTSMEVLKEQYRKKKSED